MLRGSLSKYKNVYGQTLDVKLMQNIKIMIYKHALIYRCVGAKPTAGTLFRYDGAAARFRSAAHSILRYVSKFRNMHDGCIKRSITLKSPNTRTI